MKTLFIIYLIFVFLQDLKTMYYSENWLYISLFILCFVWKPYDLSGSFYGVFMFGLPSALIYKIHKDWIGIADVLFLFYFGWILGYERMLVAMFIALLVAFLWYLISYFVLHKKEIPFVSCLCIGVGISYLIGYQIFYQILL